MEALMGMVDQAKQPVKLGQVDQEIHRLQTEVEMLMTEVNAWPEVLAPVLREPSMTMVAGKVSRGTGSRSWGTLTGSGTCRI